MKRNKPTRMKKKPPVTSLTSLKATTPRDGINYVIAECPWGSLAVKLTGLPAPDGMSGEGKLTQQESRDMVDAAERALYAARRLVLTTFNKQLEAERKEEENEDNNNHNSI